MEMMMVLEVIEQRRVPCTMVTQKLVRLFEEIFKRNHVTVIAEFILVHFLIMFSMTVRWP